MSGRATLVGLIAASVMVLGVGSFAGPRFAVAEIRVPLPGTDNWAKPRGTGYASRPVLPKRNPTRVFAGISAEALPPAIPGTSEAAAVAGTSSSASIAMVLPVRAADARKSEDEAGETEDGISAQDNAEETVSAEGETAEPEPSVSAMADVSEKIAPASGEGDIGEADIAEAEIAAMEEETEQEVALAADRDENTAETAGSASLTEMEASAVAGAGSRAEANEAEPDAAKTGEPAEMPEPDKGTDEPVGKASAGEAYTASVVLEVSPPPEVVLDIKEPSDGGAPSSDRTAGSGSDEASSDAAEVKLAALTPPTVPASGPNATAATPGDNTPSAELPEAEQAPAPAKTSEDPTLDDHEKQTGEAEDEAERPETPAKDVVVEIAEPPPPPAHPVVMRVREKLDDAEAFKSAAAGDVTALKSLYGAHEAPPLWVGDSGLTPKAKTIMATIAKADDWGLEARSFELPAEAVPSTQEAQADAEIKLSLAVLSYARDAQIGRLTPSRVSKLFDQKPKLRDPKKVLTEIAASGTPDRALLSLHPQQTKFKRLQEALVRARDSARATGRDPERDRKVQRIVINMERWRWLPRQLGSYHVWNNVPEFQVRIYKGGQPIYREKTIVGQYKYATPFFTAPMRSIVVHPNWTVPPTIVREDIAPKLKGPSGGGFFAPSKKNILRRFGLEVSYKGEPIDPDTVDWNNVNVHKYTFTQDPGPTNVLGQFKFNYPNKHAIYMHDTVQKELFSVQQRTLSHGCIRVHQPDRLAALLLREDKGWSLEQVRHLVARNQTKVIPFSKSVPVHMTYFTVTVDENGTLQDFADIYGIDNRMAPQLFANPVSFPVPATPVAETSRRTRSAQSHRRGYTNNGFDNFLSGLFGN